MPQAIKPGCRKAPGSSSRRYRASPRISVRTGTWRGLFNMERLISKARTSAWLRPCDNSSTLGRCSGQSRPAKFFEFCQPFGRGLGPKRIQLIHLCTHGGCGVVEGQVECRSAQRRRKPGEEVWVSVTRCLNRLRGVQLDLPGWWVRVAWSGCWLVVQWLLVPVPDESALVRELCEACTDNVDV